MATLQHSISYNLEKDGEFASGIFEEPFRFEDNQTQNIKGKKKKKEK